MKNNRLLIIAGIATALLIIALIIGKKQGWVGKSDATEVSVEKVTKRTIVETVAASGKVQPEAEVKISPDVPGEIIELTVKEGDKVKKGQLLVRIDPDIQQSTVERLEAGLNTSKASLANARSRKAQVDAQFANAKSAYTRNKQLYDQKVISEQEYDAATSSYEVARNEVEAANQTVNGADFSVKSAQAGLQEAQKNLTRTTIFSPVNGIISKLSVEKGERVVGTSQMAGTEIMTIANLNEMEVNVDVNENDIVRVGVGDSADIEVDAYIGRKFRGVVTSIANSANISGAMVDQVTNFEVKIRILQDSYKDLVNEKQPLLSPFRPGMSATVEIRTKTSKGILSVPIQAVTSRTASDTLNSKEQRKEKELEEKQVADAPKDGEKKTAAETKEEDVKECVFLLENGKAKLVYVKTGIQDNDYIEIISGLEENAEVITAPYSQVSKLLKDRDDVQVVEEKELYGKKKSK